MNYPKLTQPRLCRFLTYVVVIGCGLLPFVLSLVFPAPDAIRVVMLLGSLTGLLFYLIRNFVVLMSMDIALATLSCYRTARTQYVLPQNRTTDIIRQKVLAFGKSCEVNTIQPEPSALQYKFSAPLTYYSSGIERVIAAYEVEQLESDLYRAILRSAKNNSVALTGKKKARFLDESQKKAPLHRVTVVLILAHRVDVQMLPDLYKLVQRNTGDEDENCTLPCVVDLEHNTCVFDCLRVPYVGFNYAVKNRGIRMIRKLVFGGDLNLRDNTNHIQPVEDLDTEMSLWAFWKDLHHQFVGADRATKRRFETMEDRELRHEDESLFLKWDQRGVCQNVRLDMTTKTAKVEQITDWFYPKMQPIGKKTIPKLQELIVSYYEKQGYTVEFVAPEAFFE